MNLLRLIAIATISTLSTPAFAFLPEYRPWKQDDPSLSHDRTPARWAWGDGFFNRVEQNLVLSEELPNQIIEAFAFIADDGKVYNAKFAAESDDLQANADCFQAFVSASGYSKRDDQNSGKLRAISFPFSKTIHLKYKSDAVKRFFASHKTRQEDSVAIRNIPVDVLNRYPGIFTDEEIIGEKNIVAIPKATYIAGIAAHAAHWQAFFEEHPTPSKEQILQFAEK